MRSSTPWPKRLDWSASIAVACASSLMSAPAMNAFGRLKPVRMTPRTVASSRTSSNAVRRSSQVGVFQRVEHLGPIDASHRRSAPFFSYARFARVKSATVGCVEH